MITVNTACRQYVNYFSSLPLPPSSLKSTNANSCLLICCYLREAAQAAWALLQSCVLKKAASALVRRKNIKWDLTPPLMVNAANIWSFGVYRQEDAVLRILAMCISRGRPEVVELFGLLLFVCKYPSAGEQGLLRISKLIPVHVGPVDIVISSVFNVCCIYYEGIEIHLLDFSRGTKNV